MKTISNSVSRASRRWQRMALAGGAVFLWWAYGLAPDLSAQETVTIPKSRLEELERKAAAAERLEAELEKARAEINRLKGLQEATRPSTPAAIRERGGAPAREPATTPNAPAALPVKPIAGLPPLAKNAEVLVVDLLGHYDQDPAAAEARYGRQSIRLRGVVTGVQKELLSSAYRLTFRLADAPGRIVCNVYPPREFTKVYVDASGEKIVAASDSLAPRTLVEIGQEIVCAGRCAGLRDGVITLTGCTLARE